MLDQIPQFENINFQLLKFDRLGGSTNLVYRVQSLDKTWLLRMAGEGTEEYIDRKVEAYNANVAAKAGVSTKIHYVDNHSGLMLIDFIES